MPKRFPSLAIERDVKSFSYEVRQYIYDKAISARSSGRLIIVVGSGRLQSENVSTAYSPRPTLLFVDPKIDIRRGFSFKGGRDLINVDSATIVRTIVDLNRGLLSSAYYSGTI